MNRVSHPTLAAILRGRATGAPEEIAYTFLADGCTDARSITWSQLDRRARQLGASLRGLGASGEPVLLALPSGLGFVESLFGCWYAGAIAVPVSLPLHQRVKHRLNSVVADARARFAIGGPGTRERLRFEGPAALMQWLDPGMLGDSDDDIDGAEAEGHHVALLQYTSGSTGAPRGVIVTHANLLHNSALIAEACGHESGQTIAGWLPLFHDMGLIGLVLQAAFTGQRCVFMAPERFLMRPWLWLKMISDYAACSSPAPNFAYDLCAERIGAEHKAGLDLSCWRNALNGSEPIRPRTLARFTAAFRDCGFRPTAFFPCYGLAESTLFVSGPGEDRQCTSRHTNGTLLADVDDGGHVSCGRVFEDTQIAIVDPQTSVRVPAGNIGEIWLRSASICNGYWHNPEATAATFGGHLDEDRGNRDATWLRTGDLGFLAAGELFITGRLRDLIIVAGRNHFPLDIERTVEAADPMIAASGTVAFSVDVEGAERLVIAAEVRREYKRAALGRNSEVDDEAVRRRIRAAVVADNEVAPYDVVMLRPGAVPRTSSGKISRSATRQAYLSQALERWDGPIDARSVT